MKQDKGFTLNYGVNSWSDRLTITRDWSVTKLLEDNKVISLWSLVKIDQTEAFECSTLPGHVSQ